MKFPQTQQDIHGLPVYDITVFFKLLKTEGLLRPLPQRNGKYPKCQEQPKTVRDALINLLCDARWFHLSTDKNGLQVWSYDDKKLDDKICLYTKELGHILNKLAEFKDDELTKHFVKRIAEQLQTTPEETSKLLRKFHEFTQTPSTSRSQSSAIFAIEQWVSDVLRDVSGLQYDFYPEACVSLVGKPYISGYADGIIVIKDGIGNTKLFIVEYDGIAKTPDQLSARESRYLNVDLNNERFLINGEELGKVKIVKMVCGNSESELKELLRAAVIETEAIPGTVFWLALCEQVSPEGRLNNL